MGKQNRVFFGAIASIFILLISINIMQLSRADRDYACQMQMCKYRLTSSDSISYQIAGSVTNMTIDSDAESLIVNAVTDANYTEFRVLLPTHLIQATTDLIRQDSTAQINFTVYIDGNEAPFEEDTPNLLQDVPVYRYLIIPYSSGNKQIEIMGTWVSPEFQEQESIKITVQTDKEFYNFDVDPYPPVVVISGQVSTDILEDDENVVIQVLNPMGARYRVDVANVSASTGSYEYQMPIGGTIAGQSGEYKVLVSYRGTYQSETTFQYDAGGTAIDYFCIMRVCTYEVTVSNITHVIYYRMTGTITNVTADIQSKSLILDAETARGGGLQIAMPKELIVAETEQGNDDRFAILVDGNEASYDDIPRESGEHNRILRNVDNSEKYRVIYITFEGEVKQIEIVGTWIAPEFGSTLVVAIMMVASIVGTVVWSRWGTVQREKRGFR